MAQKALLIFIFFLNFLLFVFFFQKYFPLYQSSLLDSQLSQIENKIEKISKKIENLSLKIENLSSSLATLNSAQDLSQSSQNKKEINSLQKETEFEIPPQIQQKIEEKEKNNERKEIPQIFLDYPQRILAKKEFPVFVSVSGLEEKSYDVKISVQSGSKILSQIFNSQKSLWQSSNYYLPEVFVGPSFEENFKLKTKTDFFGQAEILVKIRESDTKDVVLKTSEKIKIKQETQTISSQESPQISVSPTSSFSQDCIDINTASLKDLEKLYGIGPTKAQAIVEERPFSSVDDLIRVKGIGEKTLQEIKEQGLACVK
jgi:competence ComEA-like helix-hairpin-helix protein